jgi:hypothetical protein
VPAAQPVRKPFCRTAISHAQDRHDAIPRP